MTALIAESAPAPAPGQAPEPRRRPPALVVCAFYLWLPLIVAQAIVVAYLALTLAQAARIGGPAWDVLFVDPPFAISLLMLVTLELGFAITMRRGSRVGRIALLVLALLSAAFSFLVGIPASGTRMPVVQVTPQVLAASVPFDLDLTLDVLVVVALTASVLPFLPPANRYYWKPPAAPAAVIPESAAVTDDGTLVEPAIEYEESTPDAAAPRRRGKPWPIIVAFILWWPVIVLQGAALVYLGTTIGYYLGMDMGSTVTVFFIVGAGVPVALLVVAEIVLDIAMLRGSSVARWWLLGLAIPTVIIAIWPAAVVIAAEIAGTDGGIGGGEYIATLSGIVAGVALLALVGTALTFLPRANGYLAGTSVGDEPRPRDPEPAGEREEALTQQVAEPQPQ